MPKNNSSKDTADNVNVDDLPIDSGGFGDRDVAIEFIKSQDPFDSMNIKDIQKIMSAEMHIFDGKPYTKDNVAAEYQEYIDANGKTWFAVKKSDLPNIATTGGYSVENPTGIFSSVKSDLTGDDFIEFKIKPPKSGAVEAIKDIVNLRRVKLSNNDKKNFDFETLRPKTLNQKYIDALSNIVRPVVDVDGNVVFRVTKDNLAKASSLDRAFLLSQVSFNNGVKDILSENKRLSLQRPTAKFAKSLANDWKKTFVGALQVTILALPVFFVRVAKSKNIVAGIFKATFNAGLDIAKLGLSVVGMRDIAKVRNLQGFDRVKYFVAKLAAMPINLFGGGALTEMYYNKLLRNGANKDIDKLSSGYKKLDVNKNTKSQNKQRSKDDLSTRKTIKKGVNTTIHSPKKINKNIAYDPDYSAAGANKAANWVKKHQDLFHEVDANESVAKRTTSTRRNQGIATKIKQPDRITSDKYIDKKIITRNKEIGYSGADDVKEEHSYSLKNKIEKINIINDLVDELKGSKSSDVRKKHMDKMIDLLKKENVGNGPNYVSSNLDKKPHHFIKKENKVLDVLDDMSVSDVKTFGRLINDSQMKSAVDDHINNSVNRRNTNRGSANYR